MGKKTLSFDKRRERHFKLNDKYFKKVFEFYERKEKRGNAPLYVDLPNMIALFLSISDKASENVKLIFHQKLEPNIIFKNNYFEYGIENSNSIVFDLLEEMCISVIFAYTAVEAAVNNLIPNWFQIVKCVNGKKIIEDKIFIERNYTLSDKIKKVLPQIYSYNLDFKEVEFWESFKKLEKYRDELIHYKSDEIEKNESVQLIVLTDFIFNILKYDIIQSARKFIILLSNKIDFLPGLPYEFSDEPIDIEVLKHFYSKKRIPRNK